MRKRWIVAATVMVIALCGVATATARTDLGETGGYFYVGEVVSDSGALEATAFCPTGTHVVGGGVTGGNVIEASEPADGGDANRTPDDGWHGLSNVGGSIANMSVFAVCTVDDATYVKSPQKQVAGGGGDAKVKVRCPRGTRAVSGGGRASEGVFWNWSRPFDDGDTNTIPEDGWQVQAYASGSPGTLRARAVCRPKADVDPASYSTTNGTLPTNGAALPTITCATDRHLVGMGTVTGASPDRSFTAQMGFADDAPDADSIPDDRAEAVITHNSGPAGVFWHMTAICLL